MIMTSRGSITLQRLTAAATGSALAWLVTVCGCPDNKGFTDISLALHWRRVSLRSGSKSLAAKNVDVGAMGSEHSAKASMTQAPGFTF